MFLSAGQFLGSTCKKGRQVCLYLLQVCLKLWSGLRFEAESRVLSKAEGWKCWWGKILVIFWPAFKWLLAVCIFYLYNSYLVDHLLKMIVKVLLVYFTGKLHRQEIHRLKLVLSQVFLLSPTSSSTNYLMPVDITC